MRTQNTLYFGSNLNSAFLGGLGIMLLLACERLEVIANETPEDITICVGMLDRARVVRVRPLHYLLEVDTCIRHAICQGG